MQFRPVLRLLNEVAVGLLPGADIMLSRHVQSGRLYWSDEEEGDLRKKANWSRNWEILCMVSVAPAHWTRVPRG